MMTLQDVLDAVGTTPERYGQGAWYKRVNTTYEPWCPLSVEVVRNSEHCHYKNISAAADALGCPKEHIKAFIDWWDCPTDVVKLAVFYRALLETFGYRVPPEEVRERARRCPCDFEEDTP